MAFELALQAYHRCPVGAKPTLIATGTVATNSNTIHYRDSWLHGDTLSGGGGLKQSYVMLPGSFIHSTSQWIWQMNTMCVGIMHIHVTLGDKSVSECGECAGARTNLESTP